MQTLTIEQQLRLSIVSVNLGNSIEKLRQAAIHAEGDDRRRYRDMAVKLENIRGELTK